MEKVSVIPIRADAVSDPTRCAVIDAFQAAILDGATETVALDVAEAALVARRPGLAGYAAYKLAKQIIDEQLAARRSRSA